ncbi:hypothetical protein THRCLA_23386, partial [Thraustotheca clavata]
MTTSASECDRTETLRSVGEDVNAPTLSAAQEVADMMRYVFFLILFLVVTVNVGSHATGDLPFKVTEMLNTQLRDKEFKAHDTQVYKCFQMITTIDELHEFLTGPFYEVVYGSDSFDADSTFPNGSTLPQRGTLGGASRIVGQVRIGQVRVRGQSCLGRMAYLSSLYDEVPTCYFDFSISRESKDPFGYEFNYTAFATRPAEPTFYSLSYNSFPAPMFAVMLPSEENVHCEAESGDYEHCEVYKSLESLRTNKFFDKATRGIFIDFALYDMHIDHVTTVRLFLEHFQGGGLSPQAEFLTYRIYCYSTTADWIQFGLSISLLFVVVYQLYCEVKAQVNKWKYFKNISNLVQLSNYFAFFAVLLFRILSSWSLPWSLSQDNFINFRSAITYYGLALNCHSFCCMLSWLKLFKFLSFIPMFGQLTRTVQQSAGKVIELLVIFFMCLLGASLAFTLGFGNLVYDYHSITASFFTLLHIVTGDIPLDELRQANRAIGPIFFMIYMFLMMFNIFIVIVSEAYSETKKEMRLLDMKMEVLSMEIVNHILHNVIFAIPFLGRYVFKPLYHRSQYATAKIAE